MLRSIKRKLGKIRFFWQMTQYRASLLPPSPTHIEIEPTTRCNATCGTCSRNYLAPEASKNDLSPDDLSRILDQLPALESIRLVGLGEPFLHPSIEALLAIIKKRRLKLWMISNGSYLHHEKIRTLIHDCVYELGISIDSTDPEEFARLRPMGEIGFAEVCRNARTLIEERNTGRSNVIIGINTTVTHENYTQLHTIAALCMELGVDYLAVSFVENWLKSGDHGYTEAAAEIQHSLDKQDDIIKAIKREQRRLALRGIVLGYKIPMRRIGHCHWPYRSAHITAQGLVTPCCTRTQPQHGHFNVLKDGVFSQYWHSKEYQELRQAHMRKDTLNPMCGKCPL